MNSTMYKDYGMTLRAKLIEEVNGKVTFEAVPEVDCVIIYILFKEFRFRYVVKDVADSIHFGTSDDVVGSILKRYKTSILDGFFRTEENKKRKAKKDLGIPEIVEEDDGIFIRRSEEYV